MWAPPMRASYAPPMWILREELIILYDNLCLLFQHENYISLLDIFLNVLLKLGKSTVKIALLLFRFLNWILSLYAVPVAGVSIKV
jgi:hypothetical protein